MVRQRIQGVCRRHRGVFLGKARDKRRKKIDRYYAAYEIRNGRGPYDAIDGDQIAQQEHERNIQDTLAQNCQNKGFLALARGLKEGNKRIGTGGKGTADAEDF